ncbi:class F sortase [Cohnella xylanilytica]|nr:class F sortase [Cohnella xylanilytica]
MRSRRGAGIAAPGLRSLNGPRRRLPSRTGDLRARPKRERTGSARLRVVPRFRMIPLQGVSVPGIPLRALPRGNRHSPRQGVPPPSPLPRPAPRAAAEKPAAPAPSRSFESLAFTPDRVVIPTLRIDARVEQVGVLENGRMDVPESPHVTGILSPGIKPGQKGNAVIAGHVDSHTGPAVFYPLKKAKPGDPIVVTNSKGKALVFKITSVESFKTAEAPIQRIFGPADEARLCLITCTGKFNRARREHEERLVVFARLMT